MSPYEPSSIVTVVVAVIAVVGAALIAKGSGSDDSPADKSAQQTTR